MRRGQREVRRRNAIARDLRTPKYRQRVVRNRKRQPNRDRKRRGGGRGITIEDHVGRGIE
jgi:hypothetical protein